MITEYDRIRDEYMSSLGLRVLRFTNTEVLVHIEGVVESVEEEIPLCPPLRKGEIRERGKLREITLSLLWEKGET